MKNFHCLAKSSGEKNVEQMKNMPHYVHDAVSENICCTCDRVYGSKYKSTQHVADQGLVRWTVKSEQLKLKTQH